MPAATITIRPAIFGGSAKDPELCRRLMREYGTYLNHSVGQEHICVDGLERELAGLPGAYAEPEGVVLLAFDGAAPCGCVALKPLPPSQEGEKRCEMKRLWVRPEAHGLGIGRALAERAIEHARSIGYTAMYLDTMPATMQAANALYMSLGFTPVDRYNENPVLRQSAAAPAVAFLRLQL